MFKALFRNLTEDDKNSAIEKIVVHASPRQDFFFMLILAVAMATFGVLLDSTTILISSMLIAPLLYPILSISLGVITADIKLIGRSTYTLSKSVVLAIVVSFFASLIFRGTTGPIPPSVIEPSIVYTLVAVIAGLAAAFSMTKPHLSENLPGVAVAVTLVPPLALVGVGLAYANWTIISSSIMLFLANIIGIMFSAMIAFSLMRFAVKKKVTEEAVKEEKKIVEEETGKKK